MKPLMLVAAVARNGVIGSEGALPWSYPEDMKHFRATTTGHAILMGRKTHDSIGRPLPNRRNIVITRDASARFEGCETATSLEQAIELARAADECPRVVGGGALYEAALPYATDLVLTEIDHDVEGDVKFPAFDRERFECIEERVGDTPGLVFRHYRRRA